MKKTLVSLAVLSLMVGTQVKAADASKAMPAIISYLLSGDSGGVVTQNDKFKRVSVNSTDGIVEDKQTGLFWQDIKNTEDEHQDYLHDYEGGKVKYWGNAKTYCENSTFGNHNDWRLPNETELSTIVDTGRTPTINQIFNDMPDSVFFWTSVKVGSNEAIGIDFSDGKHYTYSIQAVSYTRCVRGVRKVQILLKTGQTKKVVDFDDGYYKKGATRSYIRDDAKNIVTDNATGLQWQDNEEAKTVKKDWEDSKTYCNGLTLGGHSDWRLPTIVELLSIADLGKYEPAIDSTFQNVSSDKYWTSADYKPDTSTAWRVNFYSGYSWNDGKSNKYNIRCVRGNSIEFADSCTRNSNETVTCPDTKLIWQDNAEVADYDKRKNWQEAISYCESLNFAGQNDWRLPNQNELRSIVDFKKTSGAKIKDGFTNSASNRYWSSTTDASYTSYAWGVGFNYGDDNWRGKSYNGYVRCVRAGQ